MNAEEVRYETLVRDWAAELCSGSTRTWTEFLAAGPENHSPATDRPSPLPGAAQLELLRLLTIAGAPGAAGLAELVLATPSPGRGLVDRMLPVPGLRRGFGSPALAPEDLPANEVVRAACGVLVRLLVDLVDPVPASPARHDRAFDRAFDRSFDWARLRRLGRRGVVLAGAPLTVASIRAGLRAHGVREGGHRPTYLILGGPLEDMMAELWSARVSAGAGTRWPRFWRAAQHRSELPPRIDLARLADQAASKVGAARVQVVLGPGPDAVRAAVHRLLGLPAPSTPVDLGPGADLAGVDLLRRLNPLLVLAVGTEGRDRIASDLWPALVAGSSVGPGSGLAAAPGTYPWARQAASDLVGAVAAGDYAVHGDPSLLVPVRDPQVRRMVAAEDVLALAVRLIIVSWRTTRGGT